MPLPGNHTIATIDLTTYSPSVGATPLACYVRAPFRGKLLKVTSVLRGAITTANATVTVAVNGTTAFTYPIVQAGSAAGQLDSGTPTTFVYVNEDDVISITPSAASGANIAADFSVAIRQA